MKFFIHTTGCKANQCDAHIIANKLKREGLAPGTAANADFIIMNACTLTDGAERDIRRFINTCRRKNDRANIILTGCHAQVYPDRHYGADLILGQGEKFHIRDHLDKRGHCAADGETSFADEEPAAGLQDSRTRFFFKIQDGCDRFCSYCVVPFARGKPRSRPVNDVLRVMETLKEQGVKEAVLTGIEISSYRDQETGADLKELLRRLEDSATPERIRMSSIDPLCIDDEFIMILAGSRKLARSLHIPLQSASDTVLARMGRRYTRSYMGDLLGRLQGNIEGIGIGMDVIAGFPGEDNEEFMETYRFLESAGVYYLHVFPFSARSGTAAAAMDNQVPDTQKKARVRALKQLDGMKRRAFYERFTEKSMDIIPEGKLYKGQYMRGYTDNYLPVHIPFTKRLENNLITVTIKGIEDGILMGEFTGKQTARNTM